MKVVLADIEAKALSAAVAKLRDLGPDVCGITGGPRSPWHAPEKSDGNRTG
jgi:hypothetical protein